MSPGPGDVAAEIARLRQLGAELAKAGKVREAAEVFEQCIALRPNDPVPHIGRALALLLAGDLLEGFREYEWRRKIPQAQQTMQAFDAPRWDGRDPRGKTILLHGEQGIGDVFQFVRYATPLAECGAKVLVEVPPGIKKLVSTVPGVSEVFERGEILPKFDVHETLMSLPFHFQTTLETVPATMPYIFADPALVEQWRSRLPNGGLKIGLVWSGNPIFSANALRSTSLATLAPLFGVPNITWLALQKGEPSQQTTGTIVHRLDEQLTSWDDTAAVLANLDLFITTDTGAAHLAGAMARPTWVMIGHQHDFRWMVDRLDNPWYPTMRLFRQPSPGDWENLVRQLRHELQMHVEKR